MLSWEHFLMQQEHYKDLLCEAEKERFIRHMLASRERSDHLYGRTLSWMGCLLVAWGSQLQARALR